MTTLCGTPQYVAPEVINHSRGIEKKGYSIAVDMWSLGVILFVLLAGYPPFKENDFQKILKAEFGFDNKVWTEVSTQAKSLIEALLKLKPDDRLSVGNSLEHPWLNEKEKGKEKEGREDGRGKRKAEKEIEVTEKRPSRKAKVNALENLGFKKT
eukprot:TRINITY_DN1866_c0_g1_i1.p1 TRINITY_DN1866_c0_g1~~TRINITY_DN1866_c0_g1_i1.p1  ORF type:complete len:154 (+),score=34.96 TRINITY_DN1866_c0_g1_i1:538-999(+)